MTLETKREKKRVLLFFFFSEAFHFSRVTVSTSVSGAQVFIESSCREQNYHDQEKKMCKGGTGDGKF